MATSKQLLREIAMLKKEERKRIANLRKEKKILEMRQKHHAEKLRLERQLKELKSPGLTAFKRNLKRQLIIGFNTVALIGGGIDRSARQLIKNRAMQKQRELEILKLKAKERREIMAKRRKK